MKILRIRFQNLNSLCGTWDIRFTDPAYTENNLFAITGPTGAGKSTLLDGICLALYGATPRLGKITKTSNEIMSRHTGLCFAEVEFSTTKGTFRCHWSQHRARHKANGELQQPKHEIADALSNTILESRIRNVASKVEEVTGMDFDRFTRSTLLAQGGFAAFLQASANERAPILEQITGTEIYSQLSMKVHELLGDEQHKLNNLEQNLSQINLLSPEVEEELNVVIFKAEKESETYKAEIESLRTQQAWIDTISRLTSEKNVYIQKLELLNKETKEKRNDLDRLEPALEAKSIEPIFQELTNLLENEKNAGKEQSALEKRLDELSEKLKTGNTQTEDARKVLLKTESSRETGLLLIREVQALDHTILTSQNSLKEQSEKLAAKQTLKKEEEILINTLKQDLLEKQKNKTLLESFFKNNSCDEQLLEELGAIQIQITTINNLHEEHCAIIKTEEKVKQTRQKEKQTVTQLTQDRTKLQKEVLTAKTHFDRLQETINKILKGRAPASLQQTLFQTRNRQKTLKDILYFFSERNVQTQNLAVLHKKITDTLEQKIEIERKHSISDRNKSNKQKEIELLKKNVRLLIKIQTLEEDRKQLQDEMPCPLCGSTHHPYNHGNIPEISQEEALLQNAKEELTEITEEFAQLVRDFIVTDEKLKNYNRQVKETEGQRNQSEKEVRQLLSELEFPPLLKVNPEQLEDECLQLTKEQQQLEYDCDRLEKLNKELNIAGKNREKLLETERQLERDILEASHKTASTEKEENTLAQQARKILGEHESITNGLSQQLQVYGIPSINGEQLPFILKELEQRVKKWTENKEEEKRVIPKIISLTSELSHKETLQKNITKQIDEYSKKCQLIQREFERILKERTELFGKKEPHQESQRLEQRVKEARKKYERLQQECAETEKKATAASALLNRLQRENRARKVSIDKQKELLSQTIADSRFSNSQEFLNARIDTQQLTILQEHHNKLQKKKTELQALLKDKEIAINLEKEKQLSDKSLKEVKKQLKELEKQLEVLQEKTIATKERLKTNALDKAKSKKQLTAISSQKMVVGRWNRLHMLIGSADGKKFRNFAQGLTFEMMVHHANRHLQKMNNRYILVRDMEHPLDLNVIDTYQADEIRSTKNLSGGESFLVSLALALGLSRMASQNVRVDSLFLDEGFGTLDEEALESALETLAGLRDENKLIGIISHVVALKERIPLQIEIIPGNRGNSSIKGPGVMMELQ